MFRNPWIEDAATEWYNHAIVLRTPDKITTLFPDDHKGGVFDPAVPMDKRCGVGNVVGNVGPLKDLDGLKEGCAVCGEYVSVPHLEGKEDDRCEMTNIPGDEYLDIPINPLFESTC